MRTNLNENKVYIFYLQKQMLICTSGLPSTQPISVTCLGTDRSSKLIYLHVSFILTHDNSHLDCAVTHHKQPASEHSLNSE